MSGDSDDPVIARLWRDMSREMPAMKLDARILQAARARRQRRILLPLAAAMAACLVLAIYAMPLRPVPQPHQAKLPDTSTFGLYEGRAGMPLADSEAMQRIWRQQPGGSAYSEIVQP